MILASALTAAGWLVVVVTPGAAIITKDSAWPVHAFRMLGLEAGIPALVAYLTVGLVLPVLAVLGSGWWLAGQARSRVSQGLVFGLGAGILANHALFVALDAGSVLAEPGMAIAFSRFGDERLAAVVGVAMAANLGTYSLLGLVSGAGVPRIRRWSPGHRARGHVASRGFVLVSLALANVGLMALSWQFGSGEDGIRAFLARFDLAPGVACQESLVFAEAGGETLRLDVCGPSDPARPAPLVVCVHGGGWHGGSRDEYFSLIVRLAREGYVAIAPDYRLAPEHRFPAQWDDLAASVGWIVGKGAGTLVDAERIAVIGWSAGGHLACLLGTGISEWPRTTDNDRDRRVPGVRAVVALSPITDLTSPVWRKTRCGSEALIGCSHDECANLYRAASPVHEVTSESPPFLLVHGSADSVVPLEQSRLMEQSLRAAGVEASLREVPGVEHRWYGAAWRGAYADAERFLAAKLAAPILNAAGPMMPPTAEPVLDP